MSNEPDNGWHVKKEISVGHIFTTIMIAVAGFTWANSIETRLAVLETQQKSTAENFTDIKESLRRIEDKLDRKVDKK